jgi:hypothetical protein
VSFADPPLSIDVGRDLRRRDKTDNVAIAVGAPASA